MRITRYERRRSTPELARWALLLAEDNSEEMGCLREKLVRAMREEITPRQRQVLAMYYQESLNLEQIGLRLGVGKSSVSRTLRRGEDRLRRCLRYGSPVLLNWDPDLRCRSYHTKPCSKP